MEASKTPQVPPIVPVMTKERFSQLSGMSLDTIEGHVRRGYIPVLKIGRRSLINIALLQAECLDEEEWS